MAVITPKKRGRPRKDPMVEAADAVAIIRAEWEKRYAEMQRYYDEANRGLDFKVRNLEHQAIGYRAVISYLENTIECLIANPVRGN